MMKDTAILKRFLSEKLYHYRMSRGISQGGMAREMHISTRSYVAQEQEGMGFSALSLMRFLLLLEKTERENFLAELQAKLERGRKHAPESKD